MRWTLRLAATAAAAALVLTGSACSPASTSTPGKVDVVATTTQLADFARVIGGDHVAVHGILKANIDPHEYEPSPADIDEIATAKVIVKNGVGLESWFDDTIAAADPGGEIVDASAGVTIRHAGGGGSRAGDPHIWHDPRNAEVMVTDIERALVRADPSHRSDYERNLAGYRAQLRQLDRDISAQIDTLTNKKLVTNHDAFGYYIARYGLEFEGAIIPSFDTSAQLSAGDVQDLVDKIRATGTRAVFSESSLPPKMAEAIGREAGVTVVAGPDSLYGDTLGPPGSDGDTYLKMERHNTRVIVENLR